MRRALRRLGKQADPQARQFSVVAWGRNTEGQCGVAAYLPLLLQAREVEGLAGLRVNSLAAGKTHSAGVLESGDVMTWGEGTEGKLGHGSTDTAYVPHCVESLSGRAHITSAALGRQHTLFLDSSGQAWATGENKDGQCGLGTPLEELARQQRQQWDAGAFLQWHSSGGGGSGGGVGAPSGGGPMGAGSHRGGGAVAAAAAMHQAAYDQQQFDRSMEYVSQHGWHTTNLKPFVEHRERAAQLEAAVSMYDSDMRQLVSKRSAWQRFEAAKGADITIPGLLPGQIALPQRLGRARQGIFSPMLAELAGLDAEHIVQISAGRFMSAAVTLAGEVWTWGGGFAGELSSSSTRPATGPRRVDGVLAQVLKDNGGALKVATGGAFCTALTRSGRVVLWGQPRGGEAGAAAPTAAPRLAAAAVASPMAASGHGRRRRHPAPRPRTAAPPPQQQQAQQQQAQQQQQQLAEAAAAAGVAGAAGAEQLEVPNLRVQKQGGLLVAEVVDLPPMTDLATGFSHITFTDGSSVWSIGRQLPLSAAAAASGLSWLQPQRVMHRPDDGVSSLAAGSFASAAITGSGDLYLWGTLLTEDACSALIKKSEEEGLGHWAYSSTADPAALQWSGWEGLGGTEPRLVPGLHKVQHVSLGAHHALAVVA